jgi:hypothetical protein
LLARAALDGMPKACEPATIPNATDELQRSRDETARAGDHLTGRDLDHRHRQRGAGKKRDERRNHRPQVGVRPALVGERQRDRRDGERRRHGHDHLDARPAPTGELEDGDERSEQGCEHEIAPRRLEHEAGADRQDDVSENGHGPTEARAHGDDLAHPANGVRRRDLGAFGLLSSS